MNRVSPQGLALIARYEGFSATPYLCPAGKLTIGFGHVILPQEQFLRSISQEEALQLLTRDARYAERAVSRLIRVPLTTSQFDALVSFTFNLGAALERSRLRAVINREEHTQAPREFMRWVYASGRVLAGLVARRRAEAALYIS